MNGPLRRLIAAQDLTPHLRRGNPVCPILRLHLPQVFWRPLAPLSFSIILTNINMCAWVKRHETRGIEPQGRDYLFLLEMGQKNTR